MKAIIFDLFGTLLHIPQTASPYLQLFASARPGTDVKQLALTRDVPLSKLAQLLGSPLPAQRLAELDEIVRKEAQSAVLYPETIEALERVHAAGVRVIVSSNLATPYGAVRHLLDGLVDYWNLSYTTGYAKPDARMFIKPAEAFGAGPDDCVVIGDSLGSDGAGAKNAGMQFVLLDRKHRHHQLEAAHTLDVAVNNALAMLVPTQEKHLRVQQVALTDVQRKLLSVDRPVHIPGAAR